MFDDTEYYNNDAEQILLGTILSNNHYLSIVSDILKKEFFYHDIHGMIYEEIIRTEREGRIADCVTMKIFFERPEFYDVKNFDYLKYLILRATVIISPREYAMTIRELWQKNNLKQQLINSIKDLKTQDFDRVSLNLENEIAGLMIQGDKNKTEHIKSVLEDFSLIDNANRVPTGMKPLDKILNGGLAKKELTIIGARSGCGKTSLCQNIILNACKIGFKCLFISLEVDKNNLIIKFLSNMGSIDSRRISINNLNQWETEKINKSKNELKKFDIYMNDSSSLNIFEIEKIIKQQIKNNPVDLIALDYIQMVKTSGKNRVEEISQVTKSLKKIANNYDLAVLALAQINRDGADVLPRLQNLKGSGAIEEDADVVILVHRDLEQNKEGTMEMSENGKLVIAKGRNIGIGNVDVKFEGMFGRFSGVTDCMNYEL